MQATMYPRLGPVMLFAEYRCYVIREMLLCAAGTVKVHIVVK
jgi:hypothetical protein